MLSAHVQRLAAGHEHLEPCAVLQEVRDRRGGRGHLLEVVEDQQDVLVPQPVAELVEQRLGRGGLEADRARDRSEHRLAVAGCGEVDEEDAVLEPVDVVGGGAEGQPRLSDAAGAGQREQPDAVVREAACDLAQLCFSAHESRRLVGQPGAPARGSDQRREAVPEAWMGELEDALRAAEALELVLAEVLERGAVRELVNDECGRGGREQHLTAVPGGHDARRAVQGRAEVVALARRRLPGVQPHANAEWSGLAPRLFQKVLLGAEAGADTVDGRVEDGHEAVADRLHDLAARALDGAAQDGVVALERLLHGLLVLLPQAGAALDVGKEEGERARRRLGTRGLHLRGHAVRIKRLRSEGSNLAQV